MDHRSVMVGGGGVMNNWFVGHFAVINRCDYRRVIRCGRVRGYVICRCGAWHGSRDVDGDRGRSGSRMVNTLWHVNLLAMTVGGATN